MLLTLIGGVLLSCGAIGLIAHYQTVRSNWLLGLAAVSPYLLLGAPLAAVPFGVSRQWIGVGVATLVTLTCLATQAPLFLADRAPSTGPSIVMLTANLRLGQADPVALVNLVRTHHVDVLATQELTPAERTALGRAGLDETLPYSVVDARDGADGVGLWSSLPLHGKQQLQEFHFAFVSAKIAVPGLSTELTVSATHLPGPWRNHRERGSRTSGGCPRPCGRWRRAAGRCWWGATSMPPPIPPSSAGCSRAASTTRQSRPAPA